MDRRREHVRVAGFTAADVARLGAYPVVPHLVGWKVAEEHGVEKPYQWWIEVTAAELLTCDAVLLMLGWEASNGSRGERKLALERGIPVFESLDSLKAWLRERGIPVDG